MLLMFLESRRAAQLSPGPSAARNRTCGGSLRALVRFAHACLGEPRLRVKGLLQKVPGGSMGPIAVETSGN